jgi:CheY-like chemotaxis protein
VDNQVKISIVEGDPIYMNLVEARLQKIGYSVVSKFTSGQEAIKKLRGALPHMLVLPVNMPGEVDGIVTAQEVLSRYNVPSVFLTTSADEETLERVKRVPGAGYVLKPFSDNDLRIAIGLGLANFGFVRSVREENAQLMRLVEEIPAGIIVTNSNGLITSVNETAKVMLKWKNPALNTNIFNEIVTIIDNREGRPIEDPFAKIMGQKAVWWLPQHAVLVSHDTTKVPVAGNFSPVCDHEGRVTGMMAIMFPVAETNYLKYRGKAQF